MKNNFITIVEIPFAKTNLSFFVARESGFERFFKKDNQKNNLLKKYRAKTDINEETGG